MMKSTGMALAAALALVGAAPAAPAAPAIHLEYSFATYPLTSVVGGGSGTLNVDVLGVAPDGGLVVRGSDDWKQPWRADRPRQVVTCEVYSAGNVTCDTQFSLSPSETALFPLLARDFLKGDSLASDWKRNFRIVTGVRDSTSLATLVVAVDQHLTSSGPKNGGVLNIDATGNYSFAASGYQLQFAKSDEKIAYDTNRGLPVSVKSDWRQDARMYLAGGSVDLQLTKDTATSQ